MGSLSKQVASFPGHSHCQYLIANMVAGGVGDLVTCETLPKKGVFIHWTGGLDWTGLDWTGLTQKSVKCLFQCRTEAKHTYLFTKVACIACFRVFPRVGRGQRSRAYLISFSKKRFSQSWMIEEYYFCFLCFSKRLEIDVCGK